MPTRRGDAAAATRISIGRDRRARQVDVVATGGIEPKITQNGTAVAELGDAVEPDCLLDAVRFQETRFDETAANFTLGPVVLVASSFVPPAVPPPGAEYVLENELANSLLPAAVTYLRRADAPRVAPRRRGLRRG